MKKKKIALKRLTLSKEKVSNLNDAGSSQVYGGGTPTYKCCSISCVGPQQACGTESAADSRCVTQELGCM